MSQESSEEDRGDGTGRKTFRADSWQEHRDWFDWGTRETVMAEDCLELLIEEEYAAWAAWETVERRIDETRTGSACSSAPKLASSGDCSKTESKYNSRCSVDRL